LSTRRSSEQPKCSSKESEPHRDKRALWQAISANVGSLAAFIDAIVLNEKLPRPNRAVTGALKAAGRELFAD
jgi:hypothetical protein